MAENAAETEQTGEKKVSWLELFFDLVFVTSVSSTTHLFVSADLDPGDIVFYGGEYLLMVLPMLWAWISQSVFFNRFGDQLRHPQPFMLGQMFCLIVMTASFDFSFGHSYHSFLLGYLGIRAITITEYFVTSGRMTDHRRHVARTLALVFTTGIVISLCSLLFEGHMRYVVMYSGMVVDIIGPLIVTRTLGKVPVILSHLTERFGLFVLIAFGESLVAMTTLLVGNTSNVDMLVYVVICFCMVGTLWGSYFYSYENLIDHHRTTNGQVLLYGHVFIIIAIMLLAADIHLLQEEHEDRTVTLAILWGALAVFIGAKHVVFRHHWRSGVNLPAARTIGLIILMAMFLSANLVATIPVVVNVALAALCAVLDFYSQIGTKIETAESASVTAPEA